MKRDLERIEIPDEHEARMRSWVVVRTAFEEREPEQTTRSWRPLVVLVAAAALVAAVVSPPGRSVVDSLREAIGVESAQPALFSLPAPGRLLVTGESGPWIVQPDGSKRLLGSYARASWSPHGRFVVATRSNELAALEPSGRTRWSLARRAVGTAAWGGTRTDTRIAYASRDELRVVGGDGHGDRVLFSAPDVPEAPVAWAPGSQRLLAQSTQGILRLLDMSTGGAEVWSRTTEQPFALAWTPDGRRLVAVSRGELAVFDARGHRLIGHELAGRATAAAVNPTAHTVAVALRLRGNERSEVLTFSLDRQRAPQRRLFSGAGTFDGLAWSPNGRWLLVAWHDADQWVFVRAGQTPRIAAVSNVSAQFDDSFPRIEGWCCAG